MTNDMYLVDPEHPLQRTPELMRAASPPSGTRVDQFPSGAPTLREWLSSDELLKSNYERARRSAFEAGIARIHALTAWAVETLEELLGVKKFPAVRLGAARTIAEIALYRADAEVILRRLDEVEAAQRELLPHRKTA